MTIQDVTDPHVPTVQRGGIQTSLGATPGTEAFRPMVASITGHWVSGNPAFTISDSPCEATWDLAYFTRSSLFPQALRPLGVSPHFRLVGWTKGYCPGHFPSFPLR